MRETSHFAHRAKDASRAGGHARRECHRCGRTIPKRRGDSDYCSKKCDRQSYREDEYSQAMEREIQEQDIGEWAS